MTIEEAFELGRHNAEEILTEVYADFDYAIENLPAENVSDDITRDDKGAAIAMKARIALWQSDWEIVKNETQKLIDLGSYSLHPDYEEYFKSKIIQSIIRWPGNRLITKSEYMHQS